MGGGRHPLFAPGDFLTDERKQVAPVVDGIVVGVIPTDQQRGDADIDIVEEGSGNGLGSTNQRGGISSCPRSRRSA